MSVNSLPNVPADVPRTGNLLTRALGRSMLRLMGWQIKGDLPNHSKLVIVLAPHTSNWDFIICMASTLALGLKLSYVMKKEAFIWPFKRLFTGLGGVAVDRDQSGDMVEQLVDWLKVNNQAWLAITPEGTRKKVDTWKTGFLRIAAQAEVPVFLMAWDYPSKTLQAVTILEPTSDLESDMRCVRGLFETFEARYPTRQSPKLGR